MIGKSPSEYTTWKRARQAAKQQRPPKKYANTFRPLNLTGGRASQIADEIAARGIGTKFTYLEICDEYKISAATFTNMIRLMRTRGVIAPSDGRHSRRTVTYEVIK